MNPYTKDHPLPIAVLISGQGSNLQALIDAIANGLPAKIVVVISNKANAFGLERAKKAHIPSVVLPHQHYKSREEYDDALAQCLQKYQAELIILAGFMRILSDRFVQRFACRILNIHPALLPKYPGLDTHATVLMAQDEEHGCTVHLVTSQLDAGPIIASAKTKVSADDNVESLKQKVHRLEHKLYPHIIQLYAQGRLKITPQAIFFDGKPLPPDGLQFASSSSTWI